MNKLTSKHEQETYKDNDDETSSIDLSCSLLHKFPLFSYRKYNNIQFIYLEGNKLKNLDDDFFPTFPKLKWLDIRNNKLYEIPKTVANHPSLQVLLLEGNRLEELPSELGSIPTLRGIQLARNPLNYPPEEIINKGSSDVIHFLQKEWSNKENNVENDTPLQSCRIKRCDKKLLSGPVQRNNCKLGQRRSKTAYQPKKSRSSANSLKECVSITKLIRPKQKTSVSIDWNSVINGNDQLPEIEAIELQQSDANTKQFSLARHTTNNTKFARINDQQEKKLSPSVNSKMGIIKDVWLRRISDVLAEQETELQRTRDKDFLKKWQSDAKDLQIKKWTEYVQGDGEHIEIPFGTDEEYRKMPSRSDLEKTEKLSKSRNKPKKRSQFNSEMVASKINSIMDVLQQLRKARSSCAMSPRSEKENFCSEIKKITELQRTLSSLKAINFNQSIKL